MQIAGLNTLDLLFLVMLGLGILFGLMRGVIPQLISLFSIWLALVATLWLYKPFSVHILQGLGIPEVGSDTLAFLILIIIFSNAFRFIIKALSTPPEERKRKRMPKEDSVVQTAKSTTERFIIGPLNLIGGAIMGVVLTSLWIALIMGLVQFIFQPSDVPLDQYGASFRRIVVQLRTSALLPFFNELLVLLSRSVSLFIPRNADIFNKILQYIR